MEKDFQDRIDDYVMGRMSAEERKLFEEEIGRDESKKEQLVFTQNVKNVIGKRQYMLKETARMKEEYEAQQVKKKQLTVKRIWWTAGVAAVLLVGFFALKPFDHGSAPHLEESPSDFMRGDDEIFDFGEEEFPAVADSVAPDSLEVDTITGN